MSEAYKLTNANAYNQPVLRARKWEHVIFSFCVSVSALIEYTFGKNFWSALFRVRLKNQVNFKITLDTQLLMSYSEYGNWFCAEALIK